MSMSYAPPIDFLVIPSLAKFARQLAVPQEKPEAARKAVGLSFADITDASLCASRKNELHVRRILPHRAV